MKQLALLFLIIAQCSLIGQEDLLNDLEEEVAEEQAANPQPVEFHFKSQYLINAVTTEMVDSGALDFRITHRFGNMFGEAGGPHTLYGFDVATNIRFSFDYAINNKLQIGFGRSKIQEHLDFNLKWKVLQQMEKGTPLSLVYFTNAAFNMTRDRNDNFDVWYQRASYTHQLVMSRRFGRSITVGLLPTVVHRNLVLNPDSADVKDQNSLFALGGMIRWKVTNRVSIVGEYFYTFSEVRQSNGFIDYSNPLALGVEIETGGHVFHLNLSNSAGIITNDFIPFTDQSWLDEGFKLGFTISRNFAL